MIHQFSNSAIRKSQIVYSIDPRSPSLTNHTADSLTIHHEVSQNVHKYGGTMSAGSMTFGPPSVCQIWICLSVNLSIDNLSPQTTEPVSVFFNCCLIVNKIRKTIKMLARFKLGLSKYKECTMTTRPPSRPQ